MKPRLLDLFCCAGGGARGYADAGFAVVGVDKEPQPNYPYEFHQVDALEVLEDREFLAGFDAIHASPTCQRKARVTAWRGRRETAAPVHLLPQPPAAAVRAQGRTGVRRRHGLHVDDEPRRPSGHPARVHPLHR
jgi:hypothetical protein